MHDRLRHSLVDHDVLHPPCLTYPTYNKLYREYHSTTSIAIDTPHPHTLQDQNCDPPPSIASNNHIETHPEMLFVPWSTREGIADAVVLRRTRMCWLPKPELPTAAACSQPPRAEGLDLSQFRLSVAHLHAKVDQINSLGSRPCRCRSVLLSVALLLLLATCQHALSELVLNEQKEVSTHFFLDTYPGYDTFVTPIFRKSGYDRIRVALGQLSVLTRS